MMMPSSTSQMNAIIEDDFWQVVKEEKLQEGDFDVESSMSFGGSQWCRPTPIDENRSMEWDQQRSTLDVQHRSTSQLHHARRNPSQPSETSTYNISEQSEDAPEPMQVDQATVGRTLRKRKEKVPKHLKRGTNDKEMKTCHWDHETDEESDAKTSINAQPEISIDEKLVATIDNEFEAAIDSDHANARKMSPMEPDEYDEDYIEEEIIEYRGLAMEEPDAKAEESTSIDWRGQPSIDGNLEFRQRAYDSDDNKLFQWERRDEYDVYRDEHGYARAPDGRIIHVSRENIRDILERDTMLGETNICLPEHASMFTRSLPMLGSYSRVDIDDIVHGIYKIQDMSGDDIYKRLDDVYYPLNDSIDSLTTCKDELKEEMDMIRR
ncbi:hypothetical protein DY000_02053111 [Brassica cretica]|uniref:Uncharacterized protein n=1 Tax=Brassica cretica TaxID=69181 RepID=A0ABQ7A5Q7_BRACR|nr:hypothetical protein DY000_02053111 [Brassica cretica]